MKKRIGVLTMPLGRNYGGILQAYALQKFLEQQGYDVWSIQRVTVPKFNLIQEIKKIIKQILSIGSYENLSNMNVFIKQHIKETKGIDCPSKYKFLDRYKFDVYAVGSDQVWRFEYTKELKKEYFFDFVSNKDIKKIAFAASFGVSYWDADESTTKEISKLISTFNGVAVREKSGIDLCSKHLDYHNAINLFDPTLLHSADFYRKLYTSNEIDNLGKIGTYFLDNNEKKTSVVSEFEKKTGKQSFIIGKQKKGRNDDYPVVEQWLKDFDTADFIITDSFHGMVFSVIFEKPFCVIGNISRGLDRFRLLEEFGLIQRLVDENNTNNVDYSVLFQDIDYMAIKQKIDVNKKAALNFLEQTVGINA